MSVRGCPHCCCLFSAFVSPPGLHSGSLEPLPGRCCTHSLLSQLALHARSPCPGTAAHCAFLVGTATTPSCCTWWHCTLYPCLAGILCRVPCPVGPVPHSPVSPPALHSIALCLEGCTPNSCCCTPQEQLLHLQHLSLHPRLAAKVPQLCPIPHPACSHQDPEATPALGHPKSSSRVKRGCAGPGRASPGREGSRSAGGARRGGRNASGRAAGQVATAPASADPTRGSGRERSPGTGLAAGMGHPVAHPL